MKSSVGPATVACGWHVASDVGFMPAVTLLKHHQNAIDLVIS